MAQARGFVAVTRHVKPGMEAQFEAGVQGCLECARTFEGYCGGEVLYPAKRQGAWQVILRFESWEQFRRWEESPECRAWIERADALSTHPATVVKGNGLEGWFALPEVPAAQPPPKWKTAIASAIGLYPLLLLMPLLLEPFAGKLPPPLRALVSLAVMMPLMTWVVMPQVTRLLKGWLYPAQSRPPKA